jgi:hypothetical protein
MTSNVVRCLRRAPGPPSNLNRMCKSIVQSAARIGCLASNLLTEFSPTPVSDHGTSPARGARRDVTEPRSDIRRRVKVSPSRSREGIEMDTMELEVRDEKMR